MAKAVQALLSEGFDVVGIVGDGTSLLEEASRLGPDVLIMDIDMPGMTGLDAVARLTEDGCSAAIVMLTVYEEPELVDDALKAGARAYVTKGRLRSDLVRAIRAALQKTTFVSEP